MIVKLITSEQIRAARQLIRVTADDLSSKSGVGVATIRRYELMTGVPSGNARSVEAIQAALEEMGVEFIGTPEDRPGVRLITPKK
ncbi:helix-turn-helix transcriptional regulator [Polynucleobacter paneuropaeus]|nr:helix-turn-helix transcriptional regulator [Polynucleobacter paneuropaeus]